MIEDREFGRFESLVIARLDGLKDMGLELKECQQSIKREQKELNTRITRLEHQETRLVAMATVLSTILTLSLGVVVKMVLR